MPSRYMLGFAYVTDDGGEALGEISFEVTFQETIEALAAALAGRKLIAVSIDPVYHPPDFVQQFEAAFPGERRRWADALVLIPRKPDKGAYN